MKKIIAPLAIIAAGLLTGCVSGNKAEVSAIRIEKQSAAKEVDQYITTAGRVFRFIGLKADAERQDK